MFGIVFDLVQFKPYPLIGTRPIYDCLYLEADDNFSSDRYKLALELIRPLNHVTDVGCDRQFGECGPLEY